MVRDTEGYRATVKYIGAIASARPEEGWIGVEWDEQSRGKHDGQAYGRRYFTTEPGRGSFVRAEKLVPRLGLDEAVFLKYMSPQAKSASEVVNVRERAKGKSRVIALIVGKLQWEQHMEQVQSMQSCNLSHSDVFSCGDSLWLQQRLVNLNELILSNSLITSWCTVAAITSALPTLETLDISNNALQFTDADLDESQPVLSNSLAQIILNATGFSWSDAQFLPVAFPRLQRLHLSRNRITSLPIEGERLQRWNGLQLLILENNLIETWSGVAPLAPLPSLARLSLCGNPITDFTLSVSCGFSVLSSLGLSECRVSSWLTVNSLNNLPSLKDLRFKSCPLVESITVSDVRTQVIARIKSLQSLNSSAIRARSRIEAEKFYLLEICKSLPSSAISSASSAIAAVDTALHPRFSELVSQHGLPIAASDAASVTLAASLAEVTLQFNGQSLVKKLPLSMSLAKLRTLSGALFKAPPASLQLVLVQGGEQCVLDDDLKELAYFGFSSGSTLHITRA